MRKAVFLLQAKEEGGYFHNQLSASHILVEGKTNEVTFISPRPRTGEAKCYWCSSQNPTHSEWKKLVFTFYKVLRDITALCYHTLCRFNFTLNVTSTIFSSEIHSTLGNSFGYGRQYIYCTGQGA